MRLVITHQPGVTPGETPPKIFDLTYDPLHPVLRVGRHTSNDIVIADPSVSRHHSEIQVRPDGLVVRDLGSSNGTFINHERLKPDVAAFMSPGEELGIGNVITLLEHDFTVANPTSPATPLRNPVIYQPAPVDNPPFFEAEAPRVARLDEDIPYADPGPPIRFAEGGGPPPRFATRNQPPAAPEPIYQNNNNYNYAPYPVQPVPAPAPRPVPVPAPAPRPTRPAKATQKPASSGPNWFIIGVLLGVMILGLGILAFVIIQAPNTRTTTNTAPAATVNLPPNVFASVANEDNILGITLAHPSAWQRKESNAVVSFSPPGVATTVISLEKPPGPTIVDPNLTPEAALRQYIANVRANSQNVRVTVEPASTRLKDGTAAYFSRLIFTTSNPALTDYTINVLAFKCGSSLYFASAGAEGKNYNGATQQDLEAAIANLKC